MWDGRPAGSDAPGLRLSWPSSAFRRSRASDQPSARPAAPPLSAVPRRAPSSRAASSLPRAAALPASHPSPCARSSVGSPPLPRPARALPPDPRRPSFSWSTSSWWWRPAAGPSALLPPSWLCRSSSWCSASRRPAPRRSSCEAPSWPGLPSGPGSRSSSCHRPQPWFSFAEPSGRPRPGVSWARTAPARCSRPAFSVWTYPSLTRLSALSPPSELFRHELARELMVPQPSLFPGRKVGGEDRNRNQDLL